MKFLKVFSAFTIFLAMLMVNIPQISYAYLDPTSINFYMQVLAGGLVGIVMGLKFFWANIKSFFLKIFGKKNVAESAENEER